MDGRIVTNTERQGRSVPAAYPGKPHQELSTYSAAAKLAHAVAMNARPGREKIVSP